MAISASPITPSPKPAARCAIALGSNLGNSLEILESALAVLAATPGIQVLARSSWYLTQAVGPPQPDYFNGCALLQTQMPPQDLMTQLLHTENQFGRVRRERWGARTLDLDLLLFEDVILTTPRLELPHPRMQERAFVLVPLAEIAADWVDPRTGRSVAELLAGIDCRGVEKWQNCPDGRQSPVKELGI
ncbi:2-amino-4-hydroxy-6-hydroxymethyldihydropteridine diphosphokinase [Alkalinema sp. FACHB-956]|uniref:2-amino-4-hydroxy-6- hydroxymethyldihydropteridine diphosphokinase n=1 Tax=Alkalinema sp. FACHB-956 TaxID=2692768 RepID=UPI001682F746|nr:2-amino-4-hydroxy-6-hydroxymethyldihydropteridine diphosphokinase [Alkalinema sp. FACHB-956]MBD2329960.1 2-amino-4-hydroxy-6-hydroxymethyldihydropteridine diphosphokinase [Alkalinema sp. FACHB-956]